MNSSQSPRETPRVPSALAAAAALPKGALSVLGRLQDEEVIPVVAG